MKVGFCGPQCTGKSTQARLLSERAGYTIVKSPARALAELGVPVNRDGTLSTQLMITGQMEKDMLTTAYAGRIVWERTHIDALAYTAESELCACSEQYFDCVYMLAHKQMHCYFDIVFFFPAYPIVDFEDADDGIRDIEDEYRMRIEGRIKSLLDKLRVQYHPVPQGDPETVHNYIIEKITHQNVANHVKKCEEILTRLTANG